MTDQPTRHKESAREMETCLRKMELANKDLTKTRPSTHMAKHERQHLMTGGKPDAENFPSSRRSATFLDVWAQTSTNSFLEVGYIWNLRNAGGHSWFDQGSVLQAMPEGRRKRQEWERRSRETEGN